MPLTEAEAKFNQLVNFLQNPSVLLNNEQAFAQVLLLLSQIEGDAQQLAIIKKLQQLSPESPANSKTLGMDLEFAREMRVKFDRSKKPPLPSSRDHLVNAIEQINCAIWEVIIEKRSQYRRVDVPFYKPILTQQECQWIAGHFPGWLIFFEDCPVHVQNKVAHSFVSMQIPWES